MIRGYCIYVWQAEDWPRWRYDTAALLAPLESASRAQGLLLGRLADVGMQPRERSHLGMLTDDVVATSAIEGERLNVDLVRSSIARRLGVEVGAPAPADRRVDGVVDMVLDATTRFRAPLTAARLFRWHAALFPTGRSGMETIRVGKWRDDAQGPMQVVSGPVHRRNVHFEAPPAARLKVETKRFIEWANGATGEPALIKSGIAHLWFVTLHPFDDGNGRIARAIGDLFLARADGSAQRFYSVSGEIARSRAAYHDILERTQKGTLDATEWLAWFLETLRHAIERAQSSLDGVLSRARFWQRWAGTPMNERQAKLVNRLLDGFDGRLTSSRWATIAGCSADTALRDITELIGHGLLRRMPGGGRSTAYELVDTRASGET